MLSVIIPAYNEELMIERTAKTIGHLLDKAGIDYELIFVDDGSNDHSWAKICSAAKALNGIKGLHFSRNFGKEAAIMAGLSESKGDCCVVIDCDLQHPPEKILEMYQLWTEGYEIIEGKKSDRGQEHLLHRISAKIFYAIISAATGFDLENTSDFKLLDRKAVNILINMREHNAFFRALTSWVGFRTTIIQFDVQERSAGTSKWSMLSLIRYALNNISSFSTAPMQLVTLLGILMLVVAIVFGGISLAQKISGYALGGFTTVILLLLFIGSVIMISLGIIGFYIARIYEEIKGRPRYIIASKCGSEADENAVQKDF